MRYRETSKLERSIGGIKDMAMRTLLSKVTLSPEAVNTGQFGQQLGKALNELNKKSGLTSILGKEVVSKLYEKIRSDERHKNVLTLQQSQVSQRVFDDYESGFLVPNNTNLIFDLNSYLKYLRLLEDKEVNQIITIVESIYSKM